MALPALVMLPMRSLTTGLGIGTTRGLDTALDLLHHLISLAPSWPISVLQTGRFSFLALTA